MTPDTRPKKKRAKHVQLPWIRLETDTHRDGDILDRPAAQRPLWYALLELGGRGKPHGTIRFTDAHLAREVDISVDDVTAALDAWVECGKIVRKDGAVVVRNFRKHNPPLRFLSHGQRGDE